MTLAGKDPRLEPYGGTNLGTPLDIVNDLIVPNSQFFVRSNGLTPVIDRKDWSLTIDGAVHSPLKLDFDALLTLPQRTLTAFLACTGNGRSRFQPVAEGTPWKNDAAGNAVWTGVSMHNLLEAADPLASAVDVVTQGADLPEMRRGLPLNVALDPDTMLAFGMNGEPLPAEHGGPVRLLVPRWAGIASTKWLTRLELWDRPFTGPFQGGLYVVYDQDGTPVASIGQMPVKSVIATPPEHAKVATGPIAVSGFAWSGHAGIALVEVRVDEGGWVEADLVESAGPLSWSKWMLTVHLDTGRHMLSARATDERGIQQPRKAFWNQKGYLMNEIHTVSVVVQ
ncbi:molybdopterin-dependent oxidoreductase [soil metagenome]